MDRLIAFIATARPDDARAFYRDQVGLAFVEESDFSIVFQSGETMIRIQKVAAVAPSTDTILGWEVDDLAGRIDQLSANGVVFERFGELTPDADPVWTAPDGTMVAWFRDPDGNLLSLTQFAR